jgi:acetyl esterase/lipase
MVSPLHSVHFIERLKAAGVPHYMLLVPQATHGSDFNFSGPFAQMSTYAVEWFLQTVMK